jgi:radical SAM superfamily enzyme YgiQ (UPF0313 family)
MKVFLVYLTINTQQNIGYNYGLGYISSVLKQANHAVSYIILKENKDIFYLFERVKNEEPEIIAFSVTTCQFVYLQLITKILKRISNSFIVAGGIHPTSKPECILEAPHVDAIVRGEGEYSMIELTQMLESKLNHYDIKNFWFRNNNEIIKNETRPLISDLDILPFPDKSSFNYQEEIIDKGYYRREKGDKCNSFMFSRGCLFKCTYCANEALSDLYGNGFFRQRSPHKAIEEIELDRKKYIFNILNFDDDSISLNKKWFYEFLTLYKKNFNFPFMCNVRVGTVDSDMVRLLKEAGCFEITMGIEHGNEEFRKTILNRKMSNKQIIDTFRLCERYGINTCGQIMLGFPFENKKLYLDTVKLCRKIRKSMQNYNRYIFYPYPGTKLGKTLEDNDWLPDKKYYRERAEASISYPSFTKEEIRLCYSALPILLDYRFIPLFLPLKWSIALGYVLRKIKDFRRRVVFWFRIKSPHSKRT